MEGNNPAMEAENSGRQETHFIGMEGNNLGMEAGRQERNFMKERSLPRFSHMSVLFNPCPIDSRPGRNAALALTYGPSSGTKLVWKSVRDTGKEKFKVSLLAIHERQVEGRRKLYLLVDDYWDITGHHCGLALRKEAVKLYGASSIVRLTDILHSLNWKVGATLRPYHIWPPVLHFREYKTSPDLVQMGSPEHKAVLLYFEQPEQPEDKAVLLYFEQPRSLLTDRKEHLQYCRWVPLESCLEVVLEMIDMVPTLGPPIFELCRNRGMNLQELLETLFPYEEEDDEEEYDSFHCYCVTNGTDNLDMEHIE